ncbi:MAG: tRNA (adenosine(37)-N6)-threonylcarbamoyltransferase complex ATPase subunit type 1 TsaE [Armatimonadota bacterium]
MADQTVVFQTNSPEETEALGDRIGSALEPGTFIALFGDLGAGKTTLTKGIAKGLDVPDLVHSPTFNLIHEHYGRLPVYHFDVYRLHGSEDMFDLGYEEYFYGDGVALVEWAEKITDVLPQDRLEIHITADDDHRTLEIQATGPNSSLVLAKIINR